MAAVAGTVHDNLDHLARLGAAPGLVDHLRSWCEAELERHAPLLEERRRAGRVREGHGDLHAGNICLEGDSVIVYDAIEFSPALRCCDVARDLAFLVMDLDFRGFHPLGRLLVQRYAAASGDDGLDPLLPLFSAHLASVRAKVNCIAAADPDLSAAARAGALSTGRRYLHLAAGYGLAPPLVLLSGLPGTGKSWAAGHVASALRAVLLRSDVERKRLAGLEPTARATGTEAEALYGPQMSRMTYAHLLTLAARHLESGRAVVVDATFPDRAARAPFAALARARAAPLAVVHMTAPEPIVARRLAARAGDAQEPSDADWAVYLRARARFEPPVEIPPRQRVDHDGASGAEALVEAVLLRLVS
jgi:predicted kinase